MYIIKPLVPTTHPSCSEIKWVSSKSLSVGYGFNKVHSSCENITIDSATKVIKANVFFIVCLFIGYITYKNMSAHEGKNNFVSVIKKAKKYFSGKRERGRVNASVTD